MPPTQGMLGAHAGNMVAQTANQTPFMAQKQFPANTNAMNVNMGQPNAQAAVSQVHTCTHVPKVTSFRMAISPLNMFCPCLCACNLSFPSSSRTLTSP